MTAALALPRLVLAAPSSGAGKTTVTTGLMAALRARGLRVSPHKVGPDYIDPSYHALACGRPGRNLDAVLCGAHRLPGLFAHGAHGADLAVVEGVMGLFDGVARPAPGQDGDHASTAHVARLLDAPVVLVVDVSGAARSLAALVSGFRAFDPRLRLAGVILNRVGSDRHRDLLTDALDAIAVPVLGAVPRDTAVHTPSRHLGLVPAAERRPAAVDAVDRLGALVAATCDLDALLRVARAAPPLRVTPWDPAAALLPAAAPATGHETHHALTVGAPCALSRPPSSPKRPQPPSGARSPDPLAGDAGRPVRVAVAGGAAFTFGYAEHIDLLLAAGADVVAVDPLREETLPPGTDALIIGGGFPEEHVGALADNRRLRAEVAAFAAAGRPISAECAGLLYLARSLDGAPMCGVLPVDAVMGPRLTLGYRHAIAAHDSPLAAAGSVLGAHEFHRTILLPPATDAPPCAWWITEAAPAPRRRHQATPPPRGPSPHQPIRSDAPTRAGGDPLQPTAAATPADVASASRAEGFVHRRVHASYLHLHWAGHPDLARRLLTAARTTRPHPADASATAPTPGAGRGERGQPGPRQPGRRGAA